MDIVICAVQLARVCTSTCNDDLVAFPPEACVTLSDTSEILSTFFEEKRIEIISIFFPGGRGSSAAEVADDEWCALKIIRKWTEQYGRL